MARISRRRVYRGALYLVLVGAVVSLLADACVERYENAPLVSLHPGSGYRFEVDDSASDNTNGLFICLALSGGGTRAAALAYGVMLELHETEIEWPPGSGRRKRLLDEVDVISSVSGGSFPAAYYGLHGDAMFSEFRPRFLDRNFTWILARAVLDPRHWFALSSRTMDRSDVVAEIYGEELFDHGTFADIRARARRPFIVLNATNVAFGAQFSFTQECFDYLSSDLDSFPVARAVAASSAFPLLLSPITLRNHAAVPGQELPQWCAVALDFPEANARDYAVARPLAPYFVAKEEHPYLHLVDGGLSDNLGLRYLMHSSRGRQLTAELQGTPGGGSRSGGRIQELLVVVVNARNDPPQRHDLHAAAPGLATVGYKTANVSMENYTFETVELMNDEFVDENQDGETSLLMADLFRRLQGLAGDEEVDAGARARLGEILDDPRVRHLAKPLSQVQRSLVQISLSQVPDPKVRAELLELKTAFDLPEWAVDSLIEEGRRLLRNHPDFAMLRTRLGG